MRKTDSAMVLARLALTAEANEANLPLSSSSSILQRRQQDALAALYLQVSCISILDARLGGICSRQKLRIRLHLRNAVSKVFVSVYAKRTDKQKSTVTFEEDKVHLDLFFLDTKRFTRTLQLFGPVDPVASTFVVMGTKVDLNLKKKDNRSWAVLESKDAKAIGGFSLTFGVTGRTGTVGGKEKDLVLNAQNLKIS
ncbi:hypothetical protein CYLTODRAFT_211558 [Cylindrobasidium torrendii FP15055 ss-10]|uniref:CS domain-containing protein n=1 Tax=Cylindrobasidium torrendii FP15055 ss-10 TaxID=1314674 RepID=A0A0D7ATT2_9AGAR|nr:hypothetical protein CYLTODRAFT_211558 [Cylindrobasidium torrendii FP15055 ss-10]